MHNRKYLVQNISGYTLTIANSGFYISSLNLSKTFEREIVKEIIRDPTANQTTDLVSDIISMNLKFR
jgi:hypothetical protein